MAGYKVGRRLLNGVVYDKYFTSVNGRRTIVYIFKHDVFEGMSEEDKQPKGVDEHLHEGYDLKWFCV